MKIALPNVLLIFGCLGASHASTGDTPTSIVKAQRAEYNAAIAAHDADANAATASSRWIPPFRVGSVVPMGSVGNHPIATRATASTTSSATTRRGAG